MTCRWSMADRSTLGRYVVAAAVAAATLLAASCGSDSPANTVPSSTAPSTTEPPASAKYTVTVMAHAGPTCPVEQPGQSCPDVPVLGTVTLRAPGGEVLASGRTDTDGRWSTMIGPGMLVVEVDSGAMLPRCEPVEIQVVDRAVSVDVSCDTGIR